MNEGSAATTSIRRRVPAWLWALGLAATAGGFVNGCLTPSFQLVSPKELCKNHVIDGAETDTDCGGESCSKCELGKKCSADLDCKNESCVQHKCAEPNCSDDEINQNETDADCGGVCGSNCQVDQRCGGDADCVSASCRANRCVEASCSDGALNNAETDTDCGGSLCKGTCEVGQLCKTNADCLQPTATEGADMGMAQCVATNVEGEMRCELACPVRRGDCDGLASNGCETNTDTSQSHCGVCDSACDPANARMAHCEFGTCQIDECQSGFDDCDAEVPGCETELSTDPDHCGSCDIDCSDKNGKDTCSAGVCGIECDDGYADCDAATNPGKNGCEINTRTNVNNCGGCAEADGEKCEGDPENGIFPLCDDGACDQVDCSSYSGVAACDGDGKCDDALASPQNCGGCGLTCLVENGTPGCEQAGATYQCDVSSCDTNYANCDDVAVDCEVDIRSDAANCGGCADDDGTDCTAIEASGDNHALDVTCRNKVCVVATCEPGYAECDGDPANGCEASGTSLNRCGGCLPTDVAPGNGKDCAQIYPDAVDLSCNSEGECEVACASNLCPDATGVCDVPLGSVDSCLSCGNVCSAPNADTFATCSTTNGCLVIYPVEVVQKVSGFISAGVSAPDLVVNFDLGSGPSRGLVILAEAAHTPALRYGTTTLTPIATVQVPNHTGYVSIAFVNDAALGAAGPKSVTMSSTWGGKVLSVLELNNVAQGAARDTNLRTGAGCNTTINQLTDVSTQGSLVVAALHLQRDAAVTGAPLGGITELIDQYAPDQLSGLNGVMENVNANVTVGWNVTDSCWNYALATASFNPRVASQ